MQTYQISTYHIRIEPDLDRFTFSGCVNITVNAVNDMPVIEECPYQWSDLAFAGFCDVPKYLFNPYILSFPQERPPEI